MIKEKNQSEQKTEKKVMSTDALAPLDFVSDDFDTESSLTTNDLVAMMQDLRLSSMAEHMRALLDNPSTAPLSVRDFAINLISGEWIRRTDERQNRALKAANLRYPGATLDKSIYDPARKLDAPVIESLATCEWVRKGQNLIITGLTGAGKSYLACAFGACAVHQSLQARYESIPRLLSDLAAQDAAGTLNAAIDRLAKVDLLIVDDFGLFDIDHCAECNLLRVLDARDEQKSTLVVSQLPVASWYDLFPSPVYAEAILDRLVSRAHRVEMNGPSMRKRDLQNEISNLGL